MTSQRAIFALLSSFFLVAVSAAQTASSWVPAAASVTGTFEGSRVAVFDTAKDACDSNDIPDAMARAFRDYTGTVHMVASSDIMRQSLGPDLLTATHSCDIAFSSIQDPDPAHFNDHAWLDSFYTLDGKEIVALAHTEYHGWENTGECKTTNIVECEYDADTLHLSEDGGYHFGSVSAPANFAVGIPYVYKVDGGPSGYSVDSNIVKSGDWYYAMVTSWQWPPNCTVGSGPNRCLTFGAAPMRTKNLFDASSWRTWGGKDFSISFLDPYANTVKNPQDHVFTPVPFMDYVTGLSIYEQRGFESADRFVAIFIDSFDTKFGPEGVYLSTSTDTVHWSKPSLVITQAAMLANEPPGSWQYAYFSLLDPATTDQNFSTVGDQPFIYYVRLNNNNTSERILFRQQIKLTLNH